MTRRAATALIAVLTWGTASSAQTDFYQYWGDGKAELSSYRIVEPRYGTPREATGVMIFVTEEINRNTLIKVESNQPKSDRIYVLKLNNTLKFDTGIYPYSVMTSVFSAVEGGPSEPGVPFEPRKVTLSVQEWCGHVFEEVLLRDDEIQGDLNSYFEREGKREWEIDQTDDLVVEDHLPIELRELKGPFMPAGETRTVTFLPSLWQFRQWHAERRLFEGTIAKSHPEPLTVDGTAYQATRWTWKYAHREATMWTDTAYPHRILRWQDSAGGRGELMASIREPYWQLNGPDDGHHRQRLKLD